MAERDPYQTLGVNPGASDDEVRSTYRRLVQLYHPDHNGGSPESTRRFEEVQEAYAQIRGRRKPERGSSGDAQATPRTNVDPEVESRIADLERELREAHRGRERARQAARDATAEGADRAHRPSDEELGYVTTDDSFSKIISDARSELSDRFSDASEHPAAGRLTDLIDELASKLTDKATSPGEARRKPRRRSP